MRILTIIGLSSSLLLGCQTVPVFDRASTLDSSKVKTLFVGNTVESYNLNTGYTSFTYYHPDGGVVQERLWARRTGKWSIKDDGKICLEFAKSKVKCRHIVRERGRYYKVLPDKSGEPEKIVRYRYFSPGNALAGG